MKKIILITMSIFLGAALVGWMPAKGAAQEVSTNTRPWLEEAEFSLNAALYATLDQTIILHLEPVEALDEFHNIHGKNHGKNREHEPFYRHKALKLNTVRFLISKAVKVSFCIPSDEPFMREFTLANASGKVVLHSRQGNHCRTRTLRPGLYTLNVWHDPSNIPPSGKDVFLHRPRARLFRPSLGVEAGVDVTPLPGIPDFISFTGPNGLFVSDASSPDYALTCDSETVHPTEVWRLASVPNTPSYTFTDGPGYLVTEKLFTVPAEFYGSYEGVSGYVTPRFQFNDKGNWKFTLTAWWDPKPSITSSAGVVIDEAKTFVGDDSVSPTVFTARYQGFTCPSTCDNKTLPLQEGEIALFSKSNYQGDAVVALSDVNEFANYNATGSAQTKMESVRVGPNTFVILYDGGNMQGDQVPISVDTPSLSGTAVGSQGIMSWQIFTSAKQFILKTDTCVSCNLEGIDLSNHDLSEGVFTGSDFTNANLTGTNFSHADFEQTLLTGANLSNANFTQAVLTNANLEKSDLNATELTSANLTGATLSAPTLTSTNFQSANLTHAIFLGTTAYQDTNFSDANLACTSFSGTDENTTWNLTGAVYNKDPSVTTDFSCRLILKNVELNASTFATDFWHYFDLTGTTINNDTGITPLTLSTLNDPLDLSGAILSSVTGLSGAVLDGANLGCATPNATVKNCSQLIDTDLSEASMRKATLTNVALNGANLTNANLTEANLQGAQLLKSPITQSSATLQGAALKNANLSGADLSGANLTNANWYSTTSEVCPGSSWKGTCASGEGAALNSANFEAAYLVGLDLSGAIPQGTNFSGAILVGAYFTGANLSRDPTTGVATTFANAFLQGVDFTDAITTGVNFYSAYVDLSAGETRLFQLPTSNLEFAGFAPFAGSIPGCVEFSFSSMTTVPPTDSDNICPDGGKGACTDARWLSPITPIGGALPPSTTDTTNGLSNGCNSSTLDINWILF